MSERRMTGLFDSITSSVDTRPHACGGDSCQVCELDRERGWLTDRAPKPKALARSSDPATSKAAARSLSRESMLRVLLTAFGHKNATAEEAATAAEVDPWAASKRVSDLLNSGLIEVAIVNGNEITRRGSSGRFQRVLRITDEGRSWLAANE
jgi:hypothetical protein